MSAETHSVYLVACIAATGFYEHLPDFKSAAEAAETDRCSPSSILPR